MNEIKGVEKFLRIAFGILLLGLIIFTFFSCKSQKQITNTVETIRTITNHDTIIHTETDSAYRKLFIMCDSAFNAYIIGDTGKNGARTVINWKFKDKILEIKANVKDSAFYFKWKDLSDSIKLNPPATIQPKSEKNWWKLAFFGLLSIVIIAILTMFLFVLKK